MRLDDIQSRVGTGLWLFFLFAMSYGLAVMYPQLPSEEVLLSSKGIVPGLFMLGAFACSFFFVRSLVFTGQSDLTQMSNAELRSSACRAATVFTGGLALPLIILMAIGKMKPGPGSNGLMIFLVMPALISNAIALLLLLNIAVEGINRRALSGLRGLGAALKVYFEPRLDAAHQRWIGSRLKQKLDGWLGE